MTTPLTPLEALALTDIETPWFNGEPANYCVAFGGRAEADLAIWRRSVRQRFPPGTHYRSVASVLGSKPAATDLPGGQGERLRQIGRTRDIERYEGETDEQYCERLAGAVPAHQAKGTPSAIIRQLQAFGIADVQVFEEYEHDLSDPSDYGWRFVVVLGPNYGSLGWTATTLGKLSPHPLTLGASGLGISGAAPGQLTAVKRIILKWKQAFSFPLRVIFLFDGCVPLGQLKLKHWVLGQGSQARLSMGEVRTLGQVKLGSHRAIGFNL